MICKKMGINEDEVSIAVSMVKETGKYGTREVGLLVEHVFPKIQTFASYARKMNVKPDLSTSKNCTLKNR